MPTNTLNIGPNLDNGRVKLHGDMEVAFNTAVADSFCIRFFTTTFEVFNFTTTFDFVDHYGNTVKAMQIGGTPGTSIEMMFDPVQPAWYVTSFSGQLLSPHLITSYPWEGSTIPVSVITLTSNQTNVTTGDPVTITATISDVYQITKVEFYKNGVLFSTDTTPSFNVTDAFTSDDNGTVTYYAKLYDITNVSIVSSDLAITVNVPIVLPPPDTTLPTISLVSSSTVITNTGSIVLSATAADNVGVDHVDFYKNGTTFATVSAAPYTVVVPFTSDDNGQITYMAKAYDATNNSATSANINVLVNIVAPHDMPTVRLDATTQSEYDTAVTNAPVGGKRIAAANSLVTAMTPTSRLYIYNDRDVVIPVEYQGNCIAINDGVDIYVEPPTTITSSDPLFARDLSVGSWWFELQGGVGYTRVLTGTVGGTGSNAELILDQNPAPGQAFVATVKFVIPRSLDNLS